MQPDTAYWRSNAGGLAPYDLPVDMPVFEPPLPAPIPPRFGMVATVPTVMDVLSTNRMYPDARSRTSGYVEPGYSGTARAANSWW